MLAPSFLQTLESFIAEHSEPTDVADIISLFSLTTAAAPVKSQGHSGCVGLAIRAAIIPDLVAYIRARFMDAPVDWLLGGFIQSTAKTMWTLHPNLVQHIGISSSLPGKKQTLQSPSFKDTSCVVPTTQL
jgi:hypothetical protein